MKPLVALAALSVAVGAGLVATSALRSGAAESDQVKHEGDQAKTTATCTLKVSDMTCSGCEALVKAAAQAVDGVTEAIVSYEHGRADVAYDPVKTTPAQIAQAITAGSGFRAEVEAQPQQ